MYPPHVKREIEKATYELHGYITDFVDDFLRYYILYGDSDSELIKLIEGPEEEQQKFLAKCRKEIRARDTTTLKKTAVKKTPIKKAATKSEISSAEQIFDKMFKGWPSSSGKPTVIPYGFYAKKLKEKLKKEAQKRG